MVDLPFQEVEAVGVDRRRNLALVVAEVHHPQNLALVAAEVHHSTILA